MFNFAFEPATGILQVQVEGNWTMPEVERYGREAGVQFAKARKEAGFLRLLIELSRTRILSQDMVEPLAKAGMQHSRDDDRVAIVVNSTLMKMQMRRMVGNAPIPIFVATDEARTWLAGNEPPKLS